MTEALAIADETWKMLSDAQNELVGFLVRVSRMPRDTVADCVSQGLVDVVSVYSPVEVATEANRLYVSPRVIVHSMLRRASELHLNRERRRIARHTSDDTPIGESDGELCLRDLFVSRLSATEHIENYAEWKMFSRKAKEMCPLTSSEIDDLFGV